MLISYSDDSFEIFQLTQIQIYADAVIQGRMDWDEHNALQEKGWYFLIRIKDGKTGIKEGLTLPNIDEFDVKTSLKITRRQLK